ncbi:MAG TPA: alkaline phosphatase PhoX [Actinomycetota bacterium]|nr:alkaline phosphatase PhoX [Actinomycetota bacterium]
MQTIDRRTFLRRSLAGAAGALTFGGPFQALIARAAGAEPIVAGDNAGYGPLVPVPDHRDGVVRLHLPEGFQYRSFSYTGERMVDGVTTPGRHDGMSTFVAPRDGRVRLVRNHEVNGPGEAFGDPSKAYDPMTMGGTTTIELTPRAQRYRAWVSLNGTQMNCAGGAMPWGSWVTCEETVNGPDVGPDFTGAPNDELTQKHGYIFEVPSEWGPGDYRRVRPIRNAGRFAHEAVAVDPDTGILYLTEDNFGFPSGFYRYTAPVNPMERGRLRDGGVLEMLAVRGEPNAELHHGREVGETLPVTWVRIDDPDPEFRGTPSNDEAIQAVSRQGLDKGAAIFSRLEGLHYGDGTFYIVSTQGGDAPGGPGSGFGDGFGQVWAYRPADETLTLVFESPGPEVLELPDNAEFSPKGSVLLCEDGPVENYLRGLTPDGELFDFALNAIEGRQREEFAGATFSPNGRNLYVNIQASSALTFAIWGPWQNGPL